MLKTVNGSPSNPLKAYKPTKIKFSFMYIVESLDQRSQNVLAQIAADIELTEKPIILNNYVHIQYKFLNEEDVHELHIETPLEFAAFAHHQKLIAFYDVNEEGVHMYQRIDTTTISRFNYPYSRPGYVEVQRLHVGFTEEEVIKMIALREHDFGTRKYSYGVKQGIVRNMFEQTETKQTA